MGSTNSIPPTIPFHVAQAYGVRPGSQAPRAAPAREPDAPSQVKPAANQAAAFQSAAGPAAKLPSAAQKLVGATVPGRVDFSGEKPAQAGGQPLALYNRAADKNAAATAVSIGRSLDVRG